MLKALSLVITVVSTALCFASTVHAQDTTSANSASAPAPIAKAAKRKPVKAKKPTPKPAIVKPCLKNQKNC